MLSNSAKLMLIKVICKIDCTVTQAWVKKCKHFQKCMEKIKYIIYSPLKGINALSTTNVFPSFNIALIPGPSAWLPQMYENLLRFLSKLEVLSNIPWCEASHQLHFR